MQHPVWIFKFLSSMVPMWDDIHQALGSRVAVQVSSRDGLTLTACQVSWRLKHQTYCYITLPQSYNMSMQQRIPPATGGAASALSTQHQAEQNNSADDKASEHAKAPRMLLRQARVSCDRFLVHKLIARQMRSYAL